MAEWLLRAIYGDRYDAYSAGVEASRLDPHAVSIMNEIGIDIFRHRSKAMNEYEGILFDLAVTVCDKAREICPICGVSLEDPVNVPLQLRKQSTGISKTRLLQKVQKERSSTPLGNREMRLITG